jgi:hypothetical protein
MYVHFDFENYLGRNMEKDSNGIYFIDKMVPPGTRKFFFSVFG